MMRFVCASILSTVLLGACVSHKVASPYTAGNELDRNPTKADQLNVKACELMDKDPLGAEKLLRQALEADLYHGPAHNNLGTLLLRQGQLYSAAAEFEWAKRLLPGHPDPRLNLALTLEKGGRTDEAIAAYRTALEVYPEHIQSMEALARLQVKSGHKDSETPHLLSEVAMRGETERWREWAKLEMAKASKQR
jgi:tetratricopeptide (TPR) repeat protein